MRSFPENPGKILVRSTNWIGDAVMTTPAVRTIRKNFPESEISLLVLPWVSDVFKYSPHVDRLVFYEKNGRHKGIQGKWRLGRELKAEGYDCAILLQNAFEAAFITKIAGIAVRGGYTTDARGPLLTHKVKKHPDIKYKHQVYYYQEMLAGLGLQPADNSLEICIPEFLEQQSKDKLTKMTKGLFGTVPMVGLNPGAAYGPAKKWPAEKYGMLAKSLVEQFGAVIAVFGTEADNGAAESIQSMLPPAAPFCDFTGKTSLIEAMALIKQCDGFVTNDSGLMHVAAALEVPLAAIFGSTDHIATGPFSKQHVIIRKEIPCSPCKKPECPEKHLRCFNEIGVEDVLAGIKPFLV